MISTNNSIAWWIFTLEDYPESAKDGDKIIEIRETSRSGWAKNWDLHEYNREKRRKILRIYKKHVVLQNNVKKLQYSTLHSPLWLKYSEVFNKQHVT